MGKYLNIAKQFDARRLQEQPCDAVPFHDDAREPDPDPWLCPHCGQEAVIEDTFPSLDGERQLIMWSCEPCQVVAVTPHAFLSPHTPKRKAEVLPFLRERPPTPTAKVSPPKVRPFLPRPLGQEENPDLWDAWVPLFDWLIEHHPDHFFAVCDAEDTLNRMEREGITSGPTYASACEELRTRFETARQLKLAAKVWIQ